MGFLQFIVDRHEQALTLTLEHIWLVTLSLVIAAIIGVPLGIASTRYERLGAKILNTANVLMTVPSIALFGILLPILSLVDLGLGKVPAVIALVLYSQLPLIRNTYTGIKNVPPHLVDAARGMGMSPAQRLLQVELPLAMPVIVAGVRVAAVMNIGVAAIATYIGAGGLGVFIQMGISQVYDDMVLAGAVLVALLAVVVDAVMTAVEWAATPEGVKVARRLGK